MLQQTIRVANGFAVPRDLTRLVIGVAAVVAVWVVSVLVPVEGASSAVAALSAVARVGATAVPIGVGLYAWTHPPFERFGRLLVIAGAGVLAFSLSLSDDAVLFSVGRLANWGVTGGVLCLMLAFPSGRLADPVDRGLAASAVLLVALLYAPTALLVEHYPAPAAWTVCGSDCPPNAFMAVGQEPGIVEQLVIPVREALTIALLALIVGRLVRRLRAASRLDRRTISPVLTAAVAWGVVLGAVFAVRRAQPDAPVLDAAIWLVGFMVPAVAVAFLVGLLRSRVHVEAALRRLASRLRTGLDPAELRAALADALEDPSLEVIYRLGGRWVDAAGAIVPLPAAGSGRLVRRMGEGDRVAGALIYDEVLQGQRRFVDTAASYAAMTFENHRLAANTEELLRELDHSHARAAAVAGVERRRIERDLHDGAQQRLISLQIRLELAAERLAKDPRAGTTVLRELGTEVQAALEEIRSLARATYPSVLSERGLAAALALPAADAPIPTTVVAEALRRYPAEIEKAVYFCCREALQNASKHARGATEVRITVVEHDGSVRFEVMDDGAGFDPEAVRAGVGLTNLQDRVAAVGGRLTIDSASGRGTCVSATIPVAGRLDPPPPGAPAAADHDDGAGSAHRPSPRTGDPR